PVRAAATRATRAPRSADFRRRRHIAEANPPDGRSSSPSPSSTTPLTVRVGPPGIAPGAEGRSRPPIVEALQLAEDSGAPRAIRTPDLHIRSHMILSTTSMAYVDSKSLGLHRGCTRSVPRPARAESLAHAPGSHSKCVD